MKVAMVNSSVKDLFDRFKRMEKSISFRNRMIGSIQYWQLFRFSIFSDILKRLSLADDPHPDSSSLRKGGRGFRVWSRWARLWAGCRLFLSRYGRKTVVFGLKPRQATLVDGRRCYCMLDFFLPYLKMKYAVLSWEPIPSRTDMGNNGDIFSPPLKRLKRKFSRTCAWRMLTSEIQEEAVVIHDALKDCLGLNIPHEAIIKNLSEVILIHASTREYFRELLKRWRTKCVVLSVHYSVPSMSLAAAAHDLGLPVVELQHGEVDPVHPGYNVPDKASVFLPDYFLSWGRFWHGLMSNFPRKEAVPAGYPFFDYHIREYPRMVHDDGRVHVWFLSQGTVGVELSRLALELGELLPRERFTIHYKLHPSESDTWETLYPWLKDSCLDVVSNRERNIYSCLQGAHIAVGVNSTAIVEAFAWGARPIVLAFFAGGESLSSFVDAGYIESVRSKEELVDLVASHDAPTWTSRGAISELWSHGASDNIVRFINGVVTGGN